METKQNTHALFSDFFQTVSFFVCFLFFFTSNKQAYTMYEGLSFMRRFLAPKTALLGVTSFFQILEVESECHAWHVSN